jgi:hypothetical protein
MSTSTLETTAPIGLTAMSNAAGGDVSTTGPTEPVARKSNSQDEFGEFSYRPVPALVPISLGLLAVSVLAFLSELLVLLPLLAAGLAAWAWRKIARNSELYSGATTAKLVTVAGLVVLVAASLFHVYAIATEVPPGFERVNFRKQISNFDVPKVDGKLQIPADVQQLDGKSIFLKGYMYPTKQTRGITRFVLCRDSGECCFGGNPKVTDMVLVKLDEGKQTSFRAGLVAVAGVFHCDNDADDSGLHPVYRLDASVCEPAKTLY